jgi:predicted metalloprotease with PDZ domain
MKSILLAAGVCTIWVAFGATAPAQSALDELEERIRRQRAEAAEKTEVSAPPEEAEGVPKAPPGAGDARPEQGYLGLVADDRKTRGRGIAVEWVYEDGPAEKSGLKRGDLITAIGGVRVRAMEDAAAVLEQVRPGGKLRFEILRDGEQMELDVTFSRQPAVPPEIPDGLFPAEDAPPAEGEEITNAERIEQLQRRIAELEARVRQLERAILGER